MHLNVQTKSNLLIGPNVYVVTGVKGKLTNNLLKFRTGIKQKEGFTSRIDISINKKNINISGKLLCAYQNNWKIIKPDISSGYNHLVHITHRSKNFKILFNGKLKIDIFAGNGKHFASSYLLANAMFFHWSLYPQFGCLLHASSVINDQGKALLFIGEAGAGKSTMAELWKEKGFQVLNDDRVLISYANNDFYIAHGIPWGGTADIAEPISAPISDIYLLTKSWQGNQLKPVSPAKAVSELMNRSFHAFWSKKQVEDIFAMYQKLISQIQCHELSFMPNEKVVEFILEGE